MKYRIRNTKEQIGELSYPALPWYWQVEADCGCLGWFPRSIHATQAEAEAALAHLAE